MKNVSVKTKEKEYDVVIGKNIISSLNQFINKRYSDYSQIFLITDEKVDSLYLDEFKKQITALPLVTHTVPEGEKAKTFEVYYDCLTVALEKKLDRKTILLAFGGGAVGDLAGFVAASYMRGIPFIQVPTTILAHDSAVGGKVAINHPAGKNMIGAFYQPEAVYYDISFLSSLPKKELRSGFGEVIKHALISDPSFYQELLTNIDDLQKVNEDDWINLLEKGIMVKRAIVEEDEKEANVRAYLNFGHTLGHAIEAEMGYGKFTHGEAVVIGMVFALQLSKNVLSLEFSMKPFLNWLQKLGYSYELPKHLDCISLLERMKQDKKSVNDTIRFVLLEAIGSPALIKMDEAFLKENLVRFQNGEFIND